MPNVHLVEEDLTRSVIGAFFDVYNTMGFGFLEHPYVMAMERELQSRGHSVARQASIRVMYKGEHVATQRLDMIVDDKLVVEIKSTYRLHKAAPRQVYNYLRGTNLEVGLLLHFGPGAGLSPLVLFESVNCIGKISSIPPNPNHPFGVDLFEAN